MKQMLQKSIIYQYILSLSVLLETKYDRYSFTDLDLKYLLKGCFFKEIAFISVKRFLKMSRKTLSISPDLSGLL